MTTKRIIKDNGKFYRFNEKTQQYDEIKRRPVKKTKKSSPQLIAALKSLKTVKSQKPGKAQVDVNRLYRIIENLLLTTCTNTDMSSYHLDTRGEAVKLLNDAGYNSGFVSSGMAGETQPCRGCAARAPLDRHGIHDLGPGYCNARNLIMCAKGRKKGDIFGPRYLDKDGQKVDYQPVRES